jgi:oxygen-independent coproporphyrinogen-3 oxidase
MDHFALESDSLWNATIKGSLHRNFMGYTSRLVSPLIGLGVSSISDAWNIFVQNEKDLESYESRIGKRELPIQRGHILSREDQVLRRHILNLMTRFATDWSEGETYTPFLETIGDRLEELISDGLVRVSDRRAEVTADGKPFLRNICMAFDSRLAKNNSAMRLFSRTI